MFVPELNWQPTSSYVEPVTPVDAEPDASPGVSVCFNKAWLPYVLGALQQLAQPTTWDTDDATVLQTALDRSQLLLSLFGSAEGCMLIRWHDGNCSLQVSTDDGVTWANVDGWPDPGPPDCLHPELRIDAGGNLQITYDGGATWTTVDGWPPPTPPNPGGNTTDQNACNIATYLAQDIIQGALVAAINAFDTSLTAAAAAAAIIALIPGFGPEVALTIEAAAGIAYIIYTTGSIGDYRTASTSALLAHDLQCAIYGAIKTDGQVTAGNYAAVVAAIAAIAYSPSDVQTAINGFVGSLGLNGMLAAQQVGPLVQGDCSLCGSSMIAIAFHQSGNGLATLASDFNLGSGDWTIGFWTQRRPGTSIVDGGFMQGGNALSPAGAYWGMEYDGVTSGQMGLNASDGSSGGILQAGVTFSGGQVHQLVWTRSGSTCHNYVDGTGGGSASFPSGSYQISGTKDSYFGHAFWNWGAGGTQRYLDGMLWGIAVYVGTALSSAQVAAWYGNGPGMPPVTPTHFYACDEGAGSVLHDSVGTNDATLSGTTSWEVHS